MRRNLLLVAVAVALVAMWLIWRSDQHHDATRARDLVEAGPEAGDAPSPLVEAPGPMQERSALRAVDGGVEPSLDATLREVRGVDVVIVDALTQSPVPGAKVLTVDAPETPAIENMDPLWLHACSAFASIESNGEQFTADEHGRVFLPEIRRRTTLLGRLDDRRGIVNLDPGSSSALLELHRDFDVTARVVDDAGVPLAGVPIALSFGNEWVLREGTTAITVAPQGLATLQHVGIALAVEEDLRGFVGLAGLFDPPVRFALDPRDPPQESVTLVSPPTGELEIRLRRADGTPDIESAKLRLQIRPAASAMEEEWSSTTWLGSMEDGRIVIPRVTLGGRIRAVVYRAGFNLQTSAEAPGPTLPGERVTLTIETEATTQGPVVVARLLDEQGHPLESKPILIGMGKGEPPRINSYRSLSTDRSGRIRITMSEASDVSQPTDGLIARADSAQRRRLVAFARWPLRTAPLPGVTDLGDIVLASGPLVVGGRVLDERGLPVAGARVSIHVDGARSGIWPNYLRVRSDDSGHYEVRGLIWADRFFASAEIDEAQSPRIAFEHGATDVNLVMARTGEIAGAILLPPSLRVREFTIFAQREDATAGSRAPDIEPNGAFRLRGLAAGLYRVTIELEAETATVMELSGLRLEGGETLRPPELDPLDLRNRVHVHGLTARDPDGRAITGLEVTWRPAGQSRTDDDAYRYFDSGRARMVSLHERIDVVVEANRRRTAFIKDLIGEREIVMTPAIRVRLKLKDGAPMPSMPFALAPRLAPIPGAVDPYIWSATMFSAAREAFVDAPESCRREVQFMVFKGGEGWPDARIRPSVPQFITIADEPAEQTFEVSITEDELQRAIAVYSR